MEDRESSFHICGGAVLLVQACLCVGKTLRGGTVKHVEDCLSAREDSESSFHYYGSPVRLVQAWGKTWSRRFIHRQGAVKHV